MTPVNYIMEVQKCNARNDINMLDRNTLLKTPIFRIDNNTPAS